MNSSVVSAYENASVKAIASALERNRIDAVPVIDSARRVVGIVLVSDLFARVSRTAPPRGPHHVGPVARHRGRHALLAKDLTSAPAITTRASASVLAVAPQAVRCISGRGR
ncbi:MAG TPA: CBS domain-containing protein [Jatrophihabitans sp.]|nr:CBS domain-containing protein [Jatrophihabitans sp.]